MSHVCVYSGTLSVFFPLASLFPCAETVAKTGMILLAGEVTSRATVDYQKVVRDTIRQIGYDDSCKGVACCCISGLCFSACCFKNGVLSCCLSPAQVLTIRPAMFLWPWSSSLLTSLRVFTLIAMRRTLEQGTRSVVDINMYVVCVCVLKLQIFGL